MNNTKRQLTKPVAKMRKEFSAAIEKEAGNDPNIIFITGDLGFMALENVRDVMGSRFINAGVSEQNMITLAAGLASQGLRPICYSIAPFAVFRPAEQIRLDVCLHDMDVKIIGNGGGYGYGIMGATHHAIEDIAVLSAFQNMKCFIPFCNEDVVGAVNAMMERKGPSYLRLGFGIKPADIILPRFAPVRKICSGVNITIAAMGPVGLNVIAAMEQNDMTNDFFVFSEMPQLTLTDEFMQSIFSTGKLLIVEEHVSRGGLGEMLALMLMKEPVKCKVVHKCALGYPGGLYGSQKFHQKLCGLDASALSITIKELSK
jgi:transketolase